MKRPRRIRLGGREEIFAPPILVNAELVVIGSMNTTFALDRASLEPRWSTEGQCVALFPNVVTVLREDSVGVDVSTRRDVWRLPLQTPGHDRWRDLLVSATATHLELRSPSDSALVDTVALPWAPDGVGHMCGDLCLMSPSYSLKPRPPVICAIDLATRGVRWTRPLFEEMAAFLKPRDRPPAFGVAESSRPDQFFITHGEGVFACAMADGAIRWHAPVDVAYYTPNVADSKVFALWSRHLIALDETTGAVVYDVAPDVLAESSFPRPGVVYHGRLATIDESGHLAIFNVADGALVDFYKSKAALWRAAEVDGRLLIGTGDGSLLVFDKSIWGL